MAYKRRYKKRYSKKRSRWQNYGVGLRQLYKDVKILKSLVNVEKKYLDVVYNINPDVTLQPNALLNGLAQGDTSITRDGDSVKWVSLLLKINFLIHASATNTRVRVILIRDKQANGAIFASSTVLESSSNILSPRNIDWGKRFKVYKDMTITLNTDYPEKQVTIYLNKIKFHTRYIDGNATIASISTNSIYVCHMSDEVTNTPTVTGYSRMRFIDN